MAASTLLVKEWNHIAVLLSERADHGHHPFREAAARLAMRTEGRLAPNHDAPDGSLGRIIGGLHAFQRMKVHIAGASLRISRHIPSVYEVGKIGASGFAVGEFRPFWSYFFPENDQTAARNERPCTASSSFILDGEIHSASLSEVRAGGTKAATPCMHSERCSPL